MTAATLDITLPAHQLASPTRRSCEAACLFGLRLDRDDESPRSAHVCRLNAAPCSITLITGPSGSGKSTCLGSIKAALLSAGWRVIDTDKIRLRDKPAVDLIRGSLEGAMSLLASTGLADAHCFVRRPCELSDGQRFRLRLALAVNTARSVKPTNKPVAIVVDEFAATLDRETACCVARLFQRVVRSEQRLGAFVATSHDDLAPSLAPDAHMQITISGEAALTTINADRRTSTSVLSHTSITPGSFADYCSLSAGHYRAGAPATCVRVLVMRRRGRDEPMGVLVVSMPTLNAAWRDLAWPGRYRSGDKRLDARRLNDEVRCISRVIVDPRCRGLGVATRLVRAYLREPFTPCTEAAAAMGRWSRFFERAGMKAYTMPPSKRNARLLDALAHAGVEPWRLATPAGAWAKAAQNSGAEFLSREVRRWASGARTSARHLDDDVFDLFRRACRSAASVPVGYAHTRSS